MTTTQDAFLGGRVRITQSKDGYRAAMDPVLLAAAVPSAGRVLDLGCGVGTALLCYGARVPEAALTGLEIDPLSAERARQNALDNGMAERTTILTGELSSLMERGFDQVFANPPYDKASDAIASPHADRARSNREGTATLKDWIAMMLKAARPKGGLALVHRADRLDEILRHLQGKAGEITVIPLWPRQGIPAKRVIVRARKGVRGGAIVHPGLVLHGPEGEQRYTSDASAILRDGAALV